MTIQELKECNGWILPIKAFRWPEHHGSFRVKELKGSLRNPNEPLGTLPIRTLKNHKKSTKVQKNHANSQETS